MALTQGGKLDYFGQNVELALAIAGETPAGVVGLTASVCQEAQVAERLTTTPDQLGITPAGPGGATWVLHVQARRSSARLLPAGTSTTVV